MEREQDIAWQAMAWHGRVWHGMTGHLAGHGRSDDVPDGGTCVEVVAVPGRGANPALARI